MDKFKFFVIIVLLFAVNVFAGTDEQLSTVWIVNDFSNGLQSHVNDYDVKSNAVVDCHDVRFNKRHGSVAKRDIASLYGDAGDNKIMSLYRYYKSNGDKYLIVATDDKLLIGDDETRTFQTLKDNLTTGRRWQFKTFKDILIGFNGYDTPIKWDGNTDTGTDIGDRTENYLTADLGGCLADLTGSGSLDANSWYSYKVVFKDSDGLLYSTTAVSNPIQTGSTNLGIHLSHIPLGQTGTIERQIYRTEGQASVSALDTATYKLLTTISDNSTTTYDDYIADASLGIDLSTTDTIDVSVPNGKYIELHSDRLFVAGNNTYASDLYYSDSLNPDFFLPQSFVQVRPDDGDEITAIKTVAGMLTVFKKNSVQKFYTTGSESNWVLSGVYSTAGNIAPYSAVATPKGIMYLSSEGIYLFDGQISQLISDAVTKQIRDIQQTNLDNIYGEFWNNEYHLAYTSEESGASVNNRVLVYDTVRDAYSLDYKNVNCMTTLSSGSDFNLLFYGSSLEDGIISTEGSSISSIIRKYKDELQEGTNTDVNEFGSQASPIVKLAWDLTGDMVNLTNGYGVGDTMVSNNNTTWLIDRPKSTGEWISPVYEVNASSYAKLYWNEDLDTGEDLTVSIRSGATKAACESASWSGSFTDNTGSDLSSLTADKYVQLRFTFSTDDIRHTPELNREGNYVFKLLYNRTGAEAENSVSMLTDLGWRRLGSEGYETLIKRIRVYYRGTKGTLNVRFYNDNELDDTGDFNFDIDVSQDSSTTRIGGEGYYTVKGESKFYTYYPERIGDFWRIVLTDTDSDVQVDRIEVIVWHEELSDL